MKFLRAFARIVIGIVFLFSGFTKIIDPVGTALKIGEYLGVLGAQPWSVLYVILSVVLSATEMIIAVSVLLGLRMKIFSRVVVAFMIVFTLLTFATALFEPVSDCGCFGEAIKLSNWETFFKNLALLPFTLILFFQKDKFIPVLSPLKEWILTAVIYILFLVVSVCNYIHLPPVDFMDYKAGTDLKELASSSETEMQNTMETVLIYEKGGVDYEFYIDSLPDSTYKFVDSRTIGSKDLIFHADFAVSDSYGNYITDSIVNFSGSVFTVSVPFIDFLSEKGTKKIKVFLDSLNSKSVPFIFMSGSSAEQNQEWKDERGFYFPVYQADYKTIFGFNRSFGGAVYMNNGVIISKWSRNDLPANNLDNILKKDPELLAAEEIIKENFFLEFSLIFALLIIAILRFFFRMFYKHNKNEGTEEQES